jgi:Spy/CpxP family protein refolding chaperone
LHFSRGEEHRILIDLKHFIFMVRRIMPLAGLSLACCCAALAQPDGPGGPPPGQTQPSEHGPNVERQLKRLTQLLTLTDDQQTQVKGLLTDQRQQIIALLKPAMGSEDQPPSREAMEAARTAIKAIHADTNAKIAALLSDDQKTKFAAWEEKRAQASAQHENDDAPPPPPDGEGGPPPDGGGGPGGGGPPGD